MLTSNSPRNRIYPGGKEGLRSKNFLCEDGANAVEYGLWLALIVVVIITAVTTLGTNLSVQIQHGSHSHQ
ncbi:MAG: Flp family type IVb pilin [Desulfobaccales bacterium]